MLCMYCFREVVARETTAHAAVEVADNEEISAESELARMSTEERLMFIQTQVMSEVKSLTGRAMHPEEPLIGAGVDSRAAMELRQILSTAIGIPLPVTLLYDYQSITEIVQYINEQVETLTGKSPIPENQDMSEYLEGSPSSHRKPSNLLKTLRSVFKNKLASLVW